MKEVFTKSFWQDMKKTFDQAREDPPLAENILQIPAKGDRSVSSTLAAPSSSATPSQSAPSGTTL
jgi:hypothetical protein